MTASSAPRAIVHLAAECYPYARTGGLAEAAHGLAVAQARTGRQVSIVLPLYRSARAIAGTLEPVGGPITVRVGPREETGRLYRVAGTAAPTIYMLEHAGYFDRDGIYGEHGDYPDNARRFAFFCRASLAALPRIESGPVVLHAHDWHTSLAPLYLRILPEHAVLASRTSVVLTVHNPGYQGHFPADIVPDLGIPWEFYNWRQLEWYGQANLLKAGLAFCDEVVTVSPTQARELTTPGGGFGLHEAFRALGSRLSGIVNGIDQQVWTPGRDDYIPTRYTAEDPTGKQRCKAELQRAFSLPPRKDVPLFGFAGRLVQQKGLSLILDSRSLLVQDAQFVFLGTGDAAFAEGLLDLARWAPDRVSVKLSFSDPLEHQLIAGSDLFLMPSQYEPCGLTQMRAQRYGTLPVARRVGGLADTIDDGETGFLFDEFTGEALAEAATLAMRRWRQNREWRMLMRAAMRKDFSWGGPMQQYLNVYARANGGPS